MKCGIFHTPYNKPTRTARQVFEWSLDIAITADKAGFTDFMIGEHNTLAWENIPVPEAVIYAAIRETSRLRFAPMAHLLPYNNPATLATRIGWLSQILEDRYFLGIAPGGHQTDAVLNGYSNVMELGPPMAEALEIIEKVWAREPFKYKGDYFRAGYPGPEDMPPYHVDLSDNRPWKGMEIAVTGLSANSASMKFAGERNYSPVSFFGGSALVKNHWDIWSKAQVSKGYKPDRSRYRICRDIFIADTDAEAKRRAMNSGLGETWRHYLMPVYKRFDLFQGIIDDSGLDIAAADIDMDFLAEHVWLCGSPETVIRKLEWLVDRIGGFGQIVVQSHDSIDDPKPWNESLQRLAKEVAPKVEGLRGAAVPA